MSRHTLPFVFISVFAAAPAAAQSYAPQIYSQQVEPQQQAQRQVPARLFTTSAPRKKHTKLMVAMGELGPHPSCFGQCDGLEEMAFPFA